MWMGAAGINHSIHTPKKNHQPGFLCRSLINTLKDAINHECTSQHRTGHRRRGEEGFEQIFIEGKDVIEEGGCETIVIFIQAER